MTKHIKISHWVMSSRIRYLWPCAKASLCQWKIKHTQQLCKAGAADWNIQTNEYPSNFFPSDYCKKKPVVNNILSCLVTLNYSLTEKEEFQLCAEKLTRGQNLQTILQDCDSGENEVPLLHAFMGVLRNFLNLGNARYIYCI